MISRSTWAALSLALAMATTSASAVAQAPAASATAEALFAEGRRLAGEGKFAEACPKFEAAQKVAPTAGTLLNLADCYEKVGRIASAWASFKDAVSISRASNRTDLVGVAQRRANALEPRLPKLALSVTSPDDKLDVTRDGVLVPREAWATPVPVDPGEHVFEAKAPGKKTAKVNATAPAEGASATITIPALEIDPDAVANANVNANATPPLATGTGAPANPPPASPEGSTWSTQRTVGLVVGGVGVVALVVSGVFAITATNQNDRSKKDCRPDDETLCSASGVATRDAALRNGNLATGFFIGGAVLAAAGAVVFFTAPSKRVEAAIGPTGATLRGTF